MTDLQQWVAPTLDRLADRLGQEPDPDPDWEAPSLCAGWQVRHVVAHVTMPARLTPEQFGAEMAAARGDFGVLPVLDLLADDGGGYGVDLTGVRLEPADADWSRGSGPAVRADSGALVSLLSGRTLPDGRALPRA